MNFKCTIPALLSAHKQMAVVAVLAAGFLCAQQSALAQMLSNELPTLREVTLPGKDFQLEKPLRVRNERGQLVQVAGMVGDSLNILLPGNTGAEVGIDLNAENLRILIEYPKRFSQIQDAFNRGEFNTPATELREQCTPLFKFLRIPPESTNIHPLVLVYYKSLAAVGDVNLAVRATAEIPMYSDAVPDAFREAADMLLERCVQDGEYQAAEQVISILREQFDDQRFSVLALRTADQLRSQNQFELMERIYGTLTQSKDPAIRQQAQFWAVYSYAVGGNVVAARSLLETLPELRQADEDFNLYCLARGRLALAETNYIEALRYLTRAMVLTSIEDSYKPELYYLIVKSYIESGENLPAQMLTRELNSFYPKNPWTSAVEKEYPDVFEATQTSS